MKRSEIKTDFDAKDPFEITSNQLASQSSFEEEEESDLDSEEEEMMEKNEFDFSEAVQSEKESFKPRSYGGYSENEQRNTKFEPKITQILLNKILPMERTLFSPLAESLVMDVGIGEINDFRSKIYEKLVSEYALNRTAMQIKKKENYDKSMKFMQRNLQYRDEKEIRQNVLV